MLVAATTVVWSLELTAFWMMFFEGNIAAPPTITVFSPESSLFVILSCALTGATTAAVRANTPKAAADKSAIRLDMDSLPMIEVPAEPAIKGQQRRCPMA